MTTCLGEEQIVLILTSPLPATVLGRQLGCSHQAVCDVRNNKTHRHIRPDLERTNRYTTRRLKPHHVAYIRDSDESSNSLARRFNVSQRTIISVRRGETYRDLLDAVVDADKPHCCTCQHWCRGCGLGFPEAIEDPFFAADCSLFTPSNEAAA
jgi:hypothetical protein